MILFCCGSFNVIIRLLVIGYWYVRTSHLPSQQTESIVRNSPFTRRATDEKAPRPFLLGFSDVVVHLFGESTTDGQQDKQQQMGGGQQRDNVGGHDAGRLEQGQFSATRPTQS